MYRCAHGIKVLELRVLELTPHFYSDTMPQYLEQTIRDAQSMVPGLPEVVLQPIQLLKEGRTKRVAHAKGQGRRKSFTRGNKWRTTSLPQLVCLRPLVAQIIFHYVTSSVILMYHCVSQSRDSAGASAPSPSPRHSLTLAHRSFSITRNTTVNMTASTIVHRY